MHLRQTELRQCKNIAAMLRRRLKVPLQVRLNRCSEPLATVPFGPGFRLAARWNRLGETVKTRKKREKTGKKWARYGLKRVKEGG